jgi:uncharacterized lipoprotein YajG
MMAASIRLAHGAAVAVALTVLAGCATMSAGWYVAPDFAAASYRTFDWGRSEPGPTGDPRLDNNPFFHDRVRSSVEKQLQARGFERDQSGRAQLLLHYHVRITQRVDRSDGSLRF